jgi:hypothetical protein
LQEVIKLARFVKMKVRNAICGFGLLGALSSSVARADQWDDFRDEALSRGYGVVEVPVSNGTPKYSLWNVSEAVRGEDLLLSDGYDSRWNVTLCDSQTVRSEIVGINNRIANASADVAETVGLANYAAALRSDNMYAIQGESCAETLPIIGSGDGILGDIFRHFTGGRSKGFVLVAVKPEDLPSPTCEIPEPVVEVPVEPVVEVPVEPVVEVPVEPVVEVPSEVIVVPEVPTESVVVIPTVVPEVPKECELKILPRGRTQWDLGYRRIGVEGGAYARGFIVEHLSDTKVNTVDSENGIYFAPEVTLPILGTDNWNVFVDGSLRFSSVGGDISGHEQDHLIAGGFQYSGERFGLGAELGGRLYDRTTRAVDGDVSTTTQQVGNGLGARVLFRGPRTIIGYNFDHVPLDLRVDGSIQGYGDFTANAEADIAQHELYGGPLLGKDRLQVLPYATLRATGVRIDGDGNVPDQSNSQKEVSLGLDARLNLGDHMTLGLNGQYGLVGAFDTSVESLQINENNGNGELGLSVTFRP